MTRPAQALDPISAAPSHHCPRLAVATFRAFELPANGVEACMAGSLNVPNDRQYVGSELRCLRWATRMRSMASAGPTVPSCFARGLAAARAALVRSEIASPSFSARRL
jgi:hypothetical protein